VYRRRERRVKAKQRGERIGSKLQERLWIGGLEAVPRIESLGVSHRFLPTVLCVTPSRCRYFRDQPLLHPNVTDQHLIVWYFEDWLKKYFFSYLQILEVSHQTLCFLTSGSSFF